MTKFEKDILKNANPTSELEDDTIKWLDVNYSNLKNIENHLVELKNISDIDNNMEIVFEHDKSDKKSYISYDDIRENLGENFNEKLFKNWTSKNYNNRFIKIGDHFKISNKNNLM